MSDVSVVRPDGTHRRVRISIAPQLDADGALSGMFGTIVDVTDHFRMEQELARERTLFETLLDNIPDHIYFKDRESRFILVNKAHAAYIRAAGFDNAAGLTDFDIFSDEHARQALEDEQRIISTGDPLIAKLEKETFANGHIRWVSTTKMALRDANQEIVGTFGISRDMTERIRMEESLRRSEEHFRSIFMNAPFGVFHSTAHGKLLSANPSLARILGYDTVEELKEEVEMRGLAELLYERPDERSTMVEDVLRTRDWRSYPVRNRRKDGTFISVLVTMRPYGGPDGSPGELEGFLEDLSERENAEEEKRRLQEQLLQSQKMEAVGRLAGGVAHDFNNILTAIYGYCEIGQTASLVHGGLGEIEEMFVDIGKSAGRAANLTSQLLAFSRRRVLRPRQFDLGDLVEEMTSMLKRLLGDDVEVRACREVSLWSVHADPGQIEQVIMNLAVNARDAMPHGGVLTIDTSNCTIDGRQGAEHGEAPAGDYVLLSVSDTGTGMDAATLERIYEPFFTTKEVGKGTGLGLATVYGIVKQSDGFISCRSEVGWGTTFTVYLPRAHGETDVAMVAAWKAPRAAANESILFVDDDAAVRTVAAAILDSAGYSVVTAVDGAEFVQKPFTAAGLLERVSRVLER